MSISVDTFTQKRYTKIKNNSTKMLKPQEVILTLLLMREGKSQHVILQQFQKF